MSAARQPPWPLLGKEGNHLAGFPLNAGARSMDSRPRLRGRIERRLSSDAARGGEWRMDDDLRLTVTFRPDRLVGRATVKTQPAPQRAARVHDGLGFAAKLLS